MPAASLLRAASASAAVPFPYTIRRLPVSSFPELPAPVAAALDDRRGCLIPQTYEAHGPENVVHGSFERAGSADWAVLCSVGGGSAESSVSLLVFFASNSATPVTLATAAETDRLQFHPGHAELGFQLGHRSGLAEAGPRGAEWPRTSPGLLDHDALADSAIDRRTVYRYYARGAWSELPLPE